MITVAVAVLLGYLATATARVTTSEPYFPNLKRSTGDTHLETSGGTDDNLGYKWNEPEVERLCEDEVLEGLTVNDTIMSAKMMNAKQELTNLAHQLNIQPGKEKQRIHGFLMQHKVIPLMIYNNGTTSMQYYRNGNQILQLEDRLPMNLSTDQSWTKVIKKCIVGLWVFGINQQISDKNTDNLIAYFSVNELNVDVDQCKPNKVLGPAPKCDYPRTQCISLGGRGFRPGGYICVCRPGFYHYVHNSSLSSNFNTNTLGKIQLGKQCEMCPTSCDKGRTCTLPKECVSPSNHVLRQVILTVQIFSMSVTLVLAFVVYKNRKCKTISCGMWTIVELILLGCIILYGTVLARWFVPSTELCIIEPWCREIGFVICYGAIILKLYRILIEFRTRKAHRWVVRDKDLLKYLLGMIIVVVGYMAAWTALNLDLIYNADYNMLTVGSTTPGYSFLTCKVVSWDYVTQSSELLILIFGIHLSYASRNATSQFQERCFLCMSITVEGVISASFYIFRLFYWNSMSPDMAMLAYFLRSQATTTIIIVLILAPKWYYQKEITRCRVSRQYLTQESGRGPQEAFKPQDLLMASSGDVEREIDLAEMNPDDIRSELKRLYTQLEVLKNKTLRFENPHISKRRGGRKMAHRRFSLQNLKHRHKSTMRHDNEPEPSGTPENSICSTEGPSVIFNDGPSEVQPSPKKLPSKFVFSQENI